MTLNVLYGCMLALSGFWAAAAQDPDCWIEGMRVQGFNVDNVALPSREDCLQSCKGNPESSPVKQTRSVDVRKIAQTRLLQIQPMTANGSPSTPL